MMAGALEEEGEREQMCEGDLPRWWPPEDRDTGRMRVSTSLGQ